MIVMMYTTRSDFWTVIYELVLIISLGVNLNLLRAKLWWSNNKATKRVQQSQAILPKERPKEVTEKEKWKPIHHDNIQGYSQYKIMCILQAMFSILRRYAPISPYDIDFSQEEPKRLHVHFGQVEIREHAVTLGDHPYCRDGLCLELDWKHSRQTRIVSINAMELEKWGRPPIRPKSASEREERLRKAGGCSAKELRKAYDDALVKLDDLVEH